MSKTQTLTRKALAEIYPSICKDWKIKVADLLMASKDAENIKFDNSFIEEAYKAANNEQKQMIQRNFDLTFMGISPRVSSLEEIYKLLKVKRENVVPYSNPKTKLQKHSMLQLTSIISLCG